MWDIELWIDGSYIETLDDSIASDVIKNDFENLGNQGVKMHISHENIWFWIIP